MAGSYELADEIFFVLLDVCRVPMNTSLHTLLVGQHQGNKRLWRSSRWYGIKMISKN